MACAPSEQAVSEDLLESAAHRDDAGTQALITSRWPPTKSRRFPLSCRHNVARTGRRKERRAR